MKANEPKALADSKTGADGFRDHNLYGFPPVPMARSMRTSTTQIGRKIKDSYDIDGVTFGQAMMAIAQPNQIKAISYMGGSRLRTVRWGRRSDRGAREPHPPSFAAFSNRG